jgi:predicted amidohydrolase
MSMLRVACIQMRSGTDVAANIRAIDSAVEDAAGQGARYIQTPEMSGLVQRHRPGLFETAKAEESDLLVARAAELARRFGVYLHIGSTAIVVGEQKLANRAFVFAPDGACMARYDKIHMFDVDLDNGERWRESAVYQPGAEGRLINIEGAGLGVSICYDLRFPALAQAYAQAGASILTYPSCFTRQTGEAHWHVLLRARAIENGCFVIAAAQGGLHEDGRESFGRSLIVNPWGEIMAEQPSNEPGVIVADLDLNAVSKARSKVPNLANQRSFTISADRADHGDIRPDQRVSAT